MYLPERFKEDDQIEILKLIAQNPFATLISVRDGEPCVSHLPLIAETRLGDQLFLLGHLARANPHFKILDNSEVTAIFHGPQAYITPTWYPVNDVPTWNYAVIHVRGRVKLHLDASKTIDDLQKLSAHMESGPKAWKFWVPDDLSDRLTSAISGFHIEVSDVKAKFKLSQHRGLEERVSVIRGLRERGDGQSLALTDMMEAQLNRASLERQNS